ncbi:MAG: Na+/H+ antiporter NhaA [Chloroflexota bacterium]
MDALGTFLSAEVAGGVVLLGATLVALAWANSPAAGSYEELWRTRISIRVGEHELVSMDLRHWVNDALMALFFFVIGIEIKRELVEGELKSARRAALPVVAALGGLLLPALIFLSLNAGGPGMSGWGIPIATDIAFAVGVLALFGSRVPHALKVLLLSIAIVDDIAAIVVIALIYSGAIDFRPLAMAAVLVLGVVGLWRIPRFWRDPLVALLMVGVWSAVFASGVHATIAGVALGLVAPVRGGDPAPAERLLKTLHPWTSLLVVPLFALANAGLRLDPQAFTGALVSPVAVGIAVGLVVGKPVGIIVASWLAVRAGVAVLPHGVRWPQIGGIGATAGIGFTVSLFIASLSFAVEEIESTAKVGILVGSVIAAIVGTVLLSSSLSRRSPPTTSSSRA